MDIHVNSIVFDSRKVQENDVFVAQKGVQVDGHLYINKAILLGAIVILCENLPENKKSGVTYICLLYTSPSPRDRG